MTYKEAVQYLNSFIDYEKLGHVDKSSFKLERMQRLAGLFGNPQDAFSSVHITGTKGKGSVAAYISNILKEAGYSVGLYTSPHLITPRERIQINNEMINEDDFSREARDIQERLKGQKLDFSPTFFEIYTLLAFNYFKRMKIDHGVIEVGLGGRLDATNIIKARFAVIAPISRDHGYILGDTTREIAVEKSGIIKMGSICVSAPQDEDVTDVITKRCGTVGAELLLVGKDIRTEEVYHDSHNEVFTIRGILDTYKDCMSGLVGKFQAVNAACAVGIAESMKKRGARIDHSCIKAGIAGAANPGRCEVLSEKPYIVLDGAQNRESALALKETIRRNFVFGRLILVLGISKDKDIGGVCDEIVPAADVVILTKADIERGADPLLLRKYVKAEEVHVVNGVNGAMKTARTIATEDDMILVTGSFFVVGEARALQKAEIASSSLRSSSR